MTETKRSPINTVFTENDVGELGTLLRSGAVSAGELLEQSLAAIDEHNPALNAFTVVDRDGARAAAASADHELGRSVDRGPLHGLPVAVKDIIDINGLPTTSGSALYADRVATADADCVRALRASGAVIVGKTVLHELAYGATGDRSLHGPSRNPHDPARISGGSSGGSAVAVAAGMVPLALGTDTVGSVRVPAALCGIVGFKPTFDAISTAGVHPLAPSLDHVGIFATTVHGAAVAYGAIANAQPSAPMVASAARAAWLSPASIGAIDPEVEAQVRTTLDAAFGPSEDVGLSVTDDELFNMRLVLQSAEAAAVHADVIDTADGVIDPDVYTRLADGARVPAWQYLRAVERRADLRAEVTALLERYNVVAMPTVPTVAPKIGTDNHDLGGVTVNLRAALLALTSPWNLTGSPAISISAGNLRGLPVALQLVGAHDRERELFGIATAIETTT